MKRMLKRLFLILAVLCIPAGFFTKHEHVVFLWHKVPSIDVVFGVLGTFLLILGTRILASFARKKEDFYD
jgi:flagellar motor component MotA